MSEYHCPGQTRSHWTPDAIFEIPCPHCGKDMEFFKDEPSRPCPSCHERAINPRLDLGCAKWCQFGPQCLAQLSDSPETIGSLCDRIIARMKTVFGQDQRRIDHSLKVLDHVESIMAKEDSDKNISQLVVRAAAILHDIGIIEAEQIHGSSAGKYQELEGPPIARRILEALNAPQKDIEHVCWIIANHHSAKDIDTHEFRIVWDADWLVNFPDEIDTSDKTKTVESIERIFKTDTGKAIAKTLFWKGTE